MSNMGFSLLNLFSDGSKIDPEKLSSDQLKNRAKQALSFYYTASVKEGLKGSFEDFLKYIDKLHPTYRVHLGKMLYNAQNSLGIERVHDFMSQLGAESGGKLPSDPKDLQVFGDVLSAELSSPSLLTISRWTIDSAIETASDFKTFINKWKTPLIIGVSGLAALIIFTRLKK